MVFDFDFVPPVCDFALGIYEVCGAYDAHIFFAEGFLFLPDAVLCAYFLVGVCEEVEVEGFVFDKASV